MPPRCLTLKLFIIENDGTGCWCKQKDAASVSGYILQAMLETKYIVQPTKLSDSQTTALRAVNKILSGGSKANDAPLLRDAAVRKMKSYTVDAMELLIDERETQLSLIDDEDISVDIENLLAQFDLERVIGASDATEFKLPEDELRKRNTHTSLKYILDALTTKKSTSKVAIDQPIVNKELDQDSTVNQSEGSNNLTAADQMRAMLAKKKVTAASTTKIDDDSSSSSSTDGSENDEDDGEEMISASKGAVKGPSLPPGICSSKQLLESKALCERTITDYDSDGSDGEEIEGPMPTKAKTSAELYEYNPNKFDTSTVIGNDLSKQPRKMEGDGDRNTPRKREMLNGEVGESGREDWMMVPGTGKSMEEMLGLGGEGFGKNRTFADAKGAKKIAASMSAKGVELTGEPKELTAEEIKSQEILEEYKKRRGESLFEQHASKNASSSERGKRRKGEEGDVYFDRERDMGQHRPVDSQALQKMVREAKSMDSRFSKGGLQTKH